MVDRPPVWPNNTPTEIASVAIDAKRRSLQYEIAVETGSFWREDQRIRGGEYLESWGMSRGGLSAS